MKYRQTSGPIKGAEGHLLVVVDCKISLNLNVCFVLCGWLPFCKSYFVIGFCQKQSCVRPVDATHMAAGPDGFHQPSPIPLLEQQSVQGLARGVLVLGLTTFHHFIGLAISCCWLPWLDRSHLVGFITGQHSPHNAGCFIRHCDCGHTAGLTFQDVCKPRIEFLWRC